MKRDKFENLLHKKLSKDLPQNFDQNFWEKFEKENPKSSWNWQQILVPSLGFALLAILSIQYFKPQQINPNLAFEIMKEEELLENLELLENEELLAYTDEEWEILLGEDS